MIVTKDRASSLPAILSIHPSRFHPLDAKNSGGIFGVHDPIMHHIAGLSETSSELVEKAGSRLNFYLVDDLKPNAMFAYNDQAGEIGFSVTLRDILLTASLYISADSRFLSFVDGENSQYTYQHDIAKSDVPIGFQDVARHDSGKLVFGIPDRQHRQIEPLFQEQPTGRLHCGHAIRLLCELTVWFHELGHWIRLHVRIMQIVSKDNQSVAEVPENGPQQSDETTKFMWRSIEHDADMYSFTSLLKLIDNQAGPMPLALAGLDRSMRLLLLFISLLLTFNVISISQAIQGTDLDESYPSVFDREVYLFAQYLDKMNTSEEDKRIFNVAIREWTLISKTLGWRDFVREHNKVVIGEESDLDAYIAGIDRIREQFDRAEPA